MGKVWGSVGGLGTLGEDIHEEMTFKLRLKELIRGTTWERIFHTEEWHGDI